MTGVLCCIVLRRLWAAAVLNHCPLEAACCDCDTDPQSNLRQGAVAVTGSRKFPPNHLQINYRAELPSILANQTVATHGTFNQSLNHQQNTEFYC